MSRNENFNAAVVQDFTPVAFLSRLTPKMVNHRLEESQAGIQRLLLSVLESGDIKNMAGLRDEMVGERSISSSSSSSS